MSKNINSNLYFVIAKYLLHRRIMDRQQRTKKKFESFLYDHIWVKILIEYSIAFFVSVLSALIFAFGVVCFMRPGEAIAPDFVSGGSSGFAQTIALIFDICGIKIEDNHNLIFSLCYLVVNIPLAILAFFGIGKRFTLFTVVNVVSVFIFTNIFKGEFFEQIAEFIIMNGGILSRALFAGLTTGLSSALAFKVDSSAGGFDVVSYYLSLRKSKNVGPYGAIINGTIILTFYLLTATRGNPIQVSGETIDPWVFAISGCLFSLIYLVETMLIIDVINVRNKKVQLQIITSNENLPKLLLANVPHGVTQLTGKGVYSNTERLVLYLVISTSELRGVIHFIKEVDPSSFINVTSLMHVYGRFYMKPIK